MKRRDFLKMAGLLGIDGALPLMPSMRLFAAHDGYTGPLWLTIDARGGWDPTSFCDPKGYADPADPARINNYPASAIENVGNFSIAPPPDSFLSGGAFYNASLYSAKQFFQSHLERILVINGIDSQTNAHSDGARHNWSGELARRGYPNFGALVAGTLANSRALPFITNGGYSAGGGLLTPVRMDSRGLNALFEVSYPNRSQDPKSSTSRTYYSNEMVDLITKTSADRLAALTAAQNLTRVKSSMENLSTARVSSAHMTDLADNLEQNAEKPLTDFNGRTAARDLYRQGRLALAAYETGVSAAAHISMGGFDTHANHDQNHYPRLMDFLQGIDGILAEAQSRGLSDRVIMVVGSDFGRTNKYNGGNGKDHWPITSMLCIGASQLGIQGNRVVGQTTAAHKAINIDPQTLQPDVNGTNSNALRLTPAHVHRALRNLAGVSTSPQVVNFVLKGEDIDLLG